MPIIRLETNVPLDSSQSGDLLRKLSALASKALGKPEKYVLAALDPGMSLAFAGTEAPAALLHIQSIGLDAEACPNLADLMAAFLDADVGISPDRAYVLFNDLVPDRVGWNGTTF